MTVTTMRFTGQTDKFERFKNAKGENMIRVSAKTMPADVVMNKIKFLSSNVKEKMHTLNNTIAPLEHPGRDARGE